MDVKTILLPINFRPDPKPKPKPKKKKKPLRRSINTDAIQRLNNILKIREGKKKNGSRNYTEALLDSKFSILVRRRYADEMGMNFCFTCSKWEHWKKQECGHFVPRVHRATRWNELNCQVQCHYCNHDLQGNLEVFERNLDKMYGPGTAEDLKKLGNTTTHFTQAELKEMLSNIKEDIAKL